MISRRDFLKRVFALALGIGFVSFFAKSVFADIIFRGRDGNDILEFIYYNETTGLLTLGKRGKLIMGHETESTWEPLIDLGVNLGSASKNINDIFMGGEFHITRESASAQPTPAVGELKIWRDPDDNKTYLIYNDTDEGVRKSEFT